MNIIPELATLAMPFLSVAPVTFAKKQRNGFIAIEIVRDDNDYTEYHWASSRIINKDALLATYNDAWRLIPSWSFHEAQEKNELARWDCGPLHLFAANFSAISTFGDGMGGSDVTADAFEAAGATYQRYGIDGLNAVLEALNVDVDSDYDPVWEDNWEPLGVVERIGLDSKVVALQVQHMIQLHMNWKHDDSCVVSEIHDDIGTIQFIKTPQPKGAKTDLADNLESIFSPMSIDSICRSIFKPRICQFRVNKQGQRIWLGDGIFINRYGYSHNLPVGDSWPISVQWLDAEYTLTYGWLTPLSYDSNNACSGSTGLHLVTHAGALSLHDHRNSPLMPCSEQENTVPKPKSFDTFIGDFAGTATALFGKSFTENIELSDNAA